MKKRYRMTARKKIRISIILAAFKRPDLLVHALTAISKQDYPPSKFELIVADDDASKENKKVVDSFSKKIENIKFISNGHRGAAKARQDAFTIAKGDIFAFTDEDTIPQADWLKEIDAAFSEHPEAAGVEGKVVTDDQRDLLSHAPRNDAGGSYIGCNTHYKREVVLKNNGGYFPDFYFWREDTSMAFKALEQGPIRFSNRVVMYHPPKKMNPVSILRNLRFLKDDWILFRHYPNTTLSYLWKDWVKNGYLAVMVLLGILAHSLFPNLATDPLLIGLGIGAIGMRYSISMKNKQYSPAEGASFLFYSILKDAFYPFVWLGYFIGVVILGQPPQDVSRTAQ
jgi:glycosyltransferase involved in cell wall biosynthesis